MMIKSYNIDSNIIGKTYSGEVLKCDYGIQGLDEDKMYKLVWSDKKNFDVEVVEKVKKKFAK